MCSKCLKNIFKVFNEMDGVNNMSAACRRLPKYLPIWFDKCVRKVCQLRVEFNQHKIFIMNQFDSSFKPQSLRNWELPKWYPSRPRQRHGSSKIITNDKGHLLNRKLVRSVQSPWGNFQLPDKTNKFCMENYNDCIQKNGKLSNLSTNSNTDPYGCNKNLGIAGKDLVSPTKYRTDEEVLKADGNFPNYYEKKESPANLEYIPGNLTPFKNQHSSRNFLLEAKVDKNVKPDLISDNSYLGDHECKLKECEPFSPMKCMSSLRQTTGFSPTDEDYLNIHDTAKMLGTNSITEKPNELYPSPVAPAYANFELAKRMHSNNLDHQPLPDCVADLAFRKLQITGEHPGLALEIAPIATGVGIKTHNAGPTHCTKMKVYRPKTSGVIPRELDKNFTRSSSATPIAKKMGAMDLAICWDYKPTFEPPRPTHIDGSNDSAGPAVFTYVKTPRDDDIVNTGKSSGVFANTLEDTSFFDKAISRRNTDLIERNRSANERLMENGCPRFTGAHSVSRDDAVCRRIPGSHLLKHFKSTPDMFADQEYNTLRAKYLGSDWECPETGCKRSGFVNKARSRLCNKIAPERDCCLSARHPKRMVSKAVFRAGMPRTDAAGNYISSDSGCSIGSNHPQRVLVIPRPRNPHRKKGYDINTLVPPFQSYAGGAGEGGYPEHWRLSSVYQQAFKPLECRRKPLLQTVYK